MVNFQDLKARVTIEQVATFLKLQTKPNGEQLRGPCPACKEGGDRALVITPSKNLAYCFIEKRGGDAIWLAAHVLGVGFKEAAEQIAEHFRDSSPKPREGGENVLQPLGHLYIEPCVQDYVTKEEAEAIGIGYCRRGLMKDRIAFPIRLPNGKLVGYIGYNPEDGTLKAPKGMRL